MQHDAHNAEPGLSWHSLLGAASVTLLAAVILLLMGREPISKNGYVLLWSGEVKSSDNSQHISDWYTPSHVIHGIAFYAIFRLASRRKWSVGECLVAAVIFEAGWEILENTPFAIDRYRTATVSLNYYGDSVLNSVCDVLFCVLGFFLAWRLPVWVSVALAIIMEVVVLLVIRDNLTLNILMFLYPFDAILKWQQGA